MWQSVIGYVVFLYFVQITKGFSSRFMSEERTEFSGFVVAELQPYGFQQCVRKCEKTALCQAFDFEKEKHICLVLSDGTYNVYSEYSRNTYLSGTWNAYRKYTVSEEIRNCSSDENAITLHNNETKCIQGCRPPPVFTNTILSVSEAPGGFDLTRVGTTITYNCTIEGYRFQGGALTCKENGLWNGTDDAFGCSVLPGFTCTSSSDCQSVITLAMCSNSTCVCRKKYFFMEEKMICSKDCKSILDNGYTGDTLSRHHLRPNGIDIVKVNCEGGWTEILHRSFGDISFKNKTWDQYKVGFGSAESDYWVGLKHIHSLTYRRNEIMFTFTLQNNRSLTFYYRDFTINDESDNYRMFVSEDYTTNILKNQSYGDFFQSNGAMFSVYTRDNDQEGNIHCADRYGAWWFNNCTLGYYSITGDFDDMALFYMDADNGQMEPANVSVSTVSIKIRRQT